MCRLRLMSVRGPSSRPLESNRLYDVLRTGLASQPQRRAVYTSRGELIGHAEMRDTEYVFTSPAQLQGVRVHPPFTVEGSERGEGVASALAGVLSEALGR